MLVRTAELVRRISIPVGFSNVLRGDLADPAQLGGAGGNPTSTSTSTTVDKAGHFAAWEEPKLFSEEMRAAFESLR